MKRLKFFLSRRKIDYIAGWSFRRGLQPVEFHDFLHFLKFSQPYKMLSCTYFVKIPKSTKSRTTKYRKPITLQTNVGRYFQILLSINI
jgi:hypothetical protein